AMRAAVLTASVLGLVACDDHPSKLDRAFEQQAKVAADPWAAAFGTGAGGQTSDDDGGLGFDLQGVLERVRESIDTPGPYESPKKSLGFADDKPHWGVLGISGEITERKAFSL